LLAAASASAQPCVGDCDGNGAVAINELITGVNINLGSQNISVCENFDCQDTGGAPINCLIQGVNNSLNGCNGATPLPTPTVTPGTSTCPLEPGRYTITQGSGGTLRVATFSEFPFPAGGTVVLDVGPGQGEECLHNVVIPAAPQTVGFSAPAFCIPALGLTTKVEQEGCGVGQIDSNGGSDYTVNEVGDTSDTNGPCDLPQGSCSATFSDDSSVRVFITVGDGTPDTCAGGGTANALIAIPVHTTTWVEHSSGNHCGLDPDPITGEPRADGTFDPGPDPFTDDQLVVQFPQVLDFTTDTTNTEWQDLDGDGCQIAGFGPEGGFPPGKTGVCMDLDAKTVTTVASGPVGSSGSPTYDITFITFLPNTYEGPENVPSATCANPPTINFAGEADRCIEGQ
jgi:hypothetical protein